MFVYIGGFEFVVKGKIFNRFCIGEMFSASLLPHKKTFCRDNAR